mgnify:CR=1 FL=1
MSNSFDGALSGILGNEELMSKISEVTTSNTIII